MAIGVSFIVESINPSHNSTIQSTDVFTINFKDFMDGSTLNSSTIPLIDSQGQIVPATYDRAPNNHKTLIITPLEPLASGLYELKLKTYEEGPKANCGNVSTTPYSYYYRVESEPSEEPETPVEEPTEEPVDPTPEEPVDPAPETPLEPEIEGLFLTDSYPSAGNVRNVGEPIILIFSEEVDSNALIEQVYITKKQLHPLLAGRLENERLMLQPEEEKVSTTHTLRLAQELEEGIEAELVLTPQLMEGETIRIPFQQNWKTLYADTQDVRLVLGLFGRGFTDAELTRLVHRESISTYQIMTTRKAFDETEWGDSFPYAAGQYVIYKTAYQAILGQILESGSGMRNSFTLGDFSVAESQSTSEQIKDLLDLLKDEVDRWWKILNGIEEEEIDGLDTFIRTAGSATRGGTTSSYPDFITRVPFQELGG